MRTLNVKEKDLLSRVIRKPELQTFFFRKLKGLHWFNALNEIGFFSPEKNPKSIPAQEEGYVNIPYWPVTEYLVATSPELSAPGNEEYAEKFIDLIRKITGYARAENFSNYRTWWQFAKIIRNIPVHFIRLEDIELIDYWLDDPFERGLIVEEIGEKWLPNLLNLQDEHCQQIALHLLACLFKVKLGDKGPGFSQKKEPTFRTDSYYAKKISQKIGKSSGLKLGLPAVEIFQRLLITILEKNDNDSSSSFWRRAIEEHEQNGRHDGVDDIIVASYRDCLMGFVENNAQAAKTYFQRILNGQYQTLKRVVIYVVDKRYLELQELSDYFIEPGYFHNNFRHELWHFLKDHYFELDPKQQNKVLEIIEGLMVDEDSVINEEATAYKRVVWLSAIKDYDNTVAQTYKSYIITAGTEPDHPDFASYMTVSWGNHKSPISINELLSLDVDALVKTINNYKDTGRGWFDEPGLEGLVKTFKEVVKTKAVDIYRELIKFVNSDLAFVHPLIVAYRELWNEKKELPWNDVWPHLFEYCLKIIKREDFWSEEAAKERSHFVANRHWIVGDIGGLIEDGTKSDDHAFDRSLLGQAKDILLILLARQGGEKFKFDSDAVFVAINSPRGRCIEGLINLSLRSCRLEHTDINEHNQAWRQYENIYETELKRSTRGEFEFATLVSMYLPNFYYMSSEWVLSHLSDIFNQSNYQQWLCAMQGYSYLGNVYEIFYKHLKTGGDFLKALDDDNLKKRVDENIIQNIAIAFINNFDNINQSGSLIASLIERKKVDELSQLIWFVGTLRDQKNKKLQEKVFELWPRFLEIIDITSKEGRMLASNLCEWAAFVDKIDPIIEGWLMKIAPYAEENYNASHLLRSLAEISKTQPLEAQKTWLRMLEFYSYDYPEEAIRQILKNLIQLGADGKRKAKEIVDAYLKHGLDRPRIWLGEDEAIDNAKIDQRGSDQANGLGSYQTKKLDS